jgi:hypothetical protein
MSLMAKCTMNISTIVSIHDTLLINIIKLYNDFLSLYSYYIKKYFCCNFFILLRIENVYN